MQDEDKTKEQLITELHELRKRVAESEKNRSEEAPADGAIQRRILIEQSKDGIVVLDLDGKVCEANQNFADMLGYSLEEVYQLHVWDWDAQWTREQLQAVVRRTDAAGYRFETLHRRKDGSVYNVDISANRVASGGQRLSFCICRDITRQKRAEEELEFKNIVLTTQQETSIDGVLVVDEHDSIISFNRRFIEMFEIPPELVEARDDAPVLQLVTRMMADPEGFLARVRYLYGHREEKSHEELVLKNGRVFDRYSAPLLGADSKYYGRVWYFRDITERKRAEEAIKQQLNFQQTLIDTIPSPIFYKDIEGRYPGCNSSFESYIGLSKAGIIGKTVYDVAPKDLADIYREADLALFHELGVQQYETCVQYADGSRHDVLFTKGTFTDLDGKAAGLVGVMLDITKRKQAEQRLYKEMEWRNLLLRVYEKAPQLTNDQLYDYILDQVVQLTDSTIGFFHLVSDDQKDVILTTWNSEALKNCTASYATHYPIEQAGNWVDCVRFRRPIIYNDFPNSPNRKGLPEGHSQVQRFMSIPVLEGDKVRIIFGVGNKSEEYDEHEAMQIQVIANDLQKIIKQRRSEEELARYRDHLEDLVKERTAELARTNEQLTREVEERSRAERALQDASEKLKFFAYSLAHDLKSPAIGVYGLTKRLSKHARGVLDETARTYCDQILKVSEHIAALVEKINIYIATKEAAPLIETTNITEILRMLRDEFSSQLSLRRIGWLAPESEVEIKADRLSILRVFRNLIDNALKYGGESLTRISIGYEGTESLHIFSVSDNGKGLKEADSEKIFGLFQRNETSRGVEGAGLGLAIVKEIAEQHGGRVWVEPRGKKGITFYVSISKTLRPLQKTEQKPRPH